MPHRTILADVYEARSHRHVRSTAKELVRVGADAASMITVPAGSTASTASSTAATLGTAAVGGGLGGYLGYRWLGGLLAALLGVAGMAAGVVAVMWWRGRNATHAMTVPPATPLSAAVLAQILSVQVIPSVLTVTPGGVYRLAAEATLEGVDPATNLHTKLDVTQNVAWSCSDGRIATIDAMGVLKVLTVGDVTITAFVGGKAASASIHSLAVIPSSQGGATAVIAAKATSLTIEPSSTTAKIGESPAFTAQAGLADGTSVDVSALATTTWTSSDPSVATVAAGAATPLKEGVATIDATYDGITASTSLTVASSSGVDFVLPLPATGPPTTELSPPPATYPSGPYGLNVGDVFPNYALNGYHHGDGVFAPIEIRDYYDPTGSRGIKVLYVDVSEVSCTVCQEQFHDLITIEASVAPKGARVLAVLMSLDGSTSEGKLIVWPTVTKIKLADEKFDMARGTIAQFIPSDAGPSSWPYNYIVDARTMRIVKRWLGAGPGTAGKIEAEAAKIT